MSNAQWWKWTVVFTTVNKHTSIFVTITAQWAVLILSLPHISSTLTLLCHISLLSLYLSNRLRDRSFRGKILRRKRVNRDISQFTTKARKCFKMDMFATKERKCILCQSTTQIYARFDYKLHVIRQHQTNIVHKNLFNVCKFTTSYTFCVKVAEKYTQYA